MSAATVRTVLVLALFAGPAHAQGLERYFNAETPMHSAVATATVAGETFVLVCNAPDNSVEVYTSADTPCFVGRAPTGLEPVSVVVDPVAQPDGSVRAYTANWLGDSITVFELRPIAGSNPCGGLNLELRLVTTKSVRDEPTGLALVPAVRGKPWGGTSLVYTSPTRRILGWLDRETLQPVDVGYDHLELVDDSSAFGLDRPTAVAFSPSTAGGNNVPDVLCVLNLLGGTADSVYDYDLWVATDPWQTFADQLLGPPVHSAEPVLGGIGSGSFHFDFAPNGDLWVATQQALNKEGHDDFLTECDGEADVLALSAQGTGFVVSRLVRVEGVGSANPSVEVLDLNDDGTGNQASLPVTQPTDVVALGTGAGADTRIFVTGFNSDSIAVVERPVPPATAWTVHRIDVTPPGGFDHDNLSGTMRGPRALAAMWDGVTRAPTDRVFVYNMIEHSLSVIDPNFTDPGSALLSTVPLSADPQPAYVRDNRKLLYSSKLSAAGNVSCVSCHLDGRNDHLAWNLTDNVLVPPEGDPTALPGALGPNGAKKALQTTQDLRGLVTFEVPNAAVEHEYYSAKPYHWRGDRPDIASFNLGFISLLGHPDPGGLPEDALADLTEFVNSLHYPPNPNQPVDRIYSGAMSDGAPLSLGDPMKAWQGGSPSGATDAFNDPEQGSGAQRGLKLFHIESPYGPETDPAAIACVSCHSLPDGSNGRLTDLNEPYFAGGVAVPGISGTISVMSAKLQGVFLKGQFLVRKDPGDNKFRDYPPGSVRARISEFGTAHAGTDVFGPAPTLLDDGLEEFLFEGFNDLRVDAARRRAVGAYVVELDTGVAPIVGRVETWTPADLAADPGAIDAVLDLMEAQAQAANAGLVAHARIAGVGAGETRGFVFDVTDDTAPYHDVAYGGLPPIASMTRQELLDVLDPSQPLGDPDNVLSVQSVPLGSEHRVAHLGGGLPALPAAAPTPSNVVLEGATTIVANRDIAKMTRFWKIDGVEPSAVANIFGQGENLERSFNNNISIYWLQTSLMLWASGAPWNSFGLTDWRHEAPRRFRVSGDGITYGAKLRLFTPRKADINTATPTSPPTTSFGPSTHTVIELPLHPLRDENGELFWETDAELEPLHLYAFMNGGPDNVTVRTILEQPFLGVLTNLFFTDMVGSTKWNYWGVEVANVIAGGEVAAGGGWQRITLID